MNILVGGLTSLKTWLEKNDDTLKERKRIFAQPSTEAAESAGSPQQKNEKVSSTASNSSDEQQNQLMRKADNIDEQSDNIVRPINAPSDMDKLTLVSLELLDIGAAYGERGVNAVQKNEYYQQLNSKLAIDDKVVFAMGLAQDCYSNMHRIVVAIRSSDRQVLLSYLPDISERLDGSAVGSLIKAYPVYTEIGQKYLSRTHDFVATAVSKARELSVLLHERLDADKDGAVSCSDLKESATTLWINARQLDWKTLQQYKLSLYEVAIKSMKEQLEADEKFLQQRQQEREQQVSCEQAEAHEQLAKSTVKKDKKISRSISKDKSA